MRDTVLFIQEKFRKTCPESQINLIIRGKRSFSSNDIFTKQAM